ncbi:ribosomal oxygenase 2-like isoform X2 [Ischnura elegans]|uniref:ribosomal oxygenase 2-like isoform X2 n=1 Tax=Ischnura elegans TaxID=197161 RepID=UPI001ED8777C|nr:ribosomal oxygenase 2-like isoform X2 [Ischnura elegans]
MGRGKKKRKIDSDGDNVSVTDATRTTRKEAAEEVPNRRKRISNGEKCETEDGMAYYFDYASPKRLFESLIHPQNFNSFFEEYWEKKPLVIARGLSTPVLDKFTALFSRSTLMNIVKTKNVHFERDLNIFRYRNGKRDNLNDKGRVSGKLEKIINKEKVTVQFHQPQRFQDSLWQLMEMLESFFGCLVGANVYITPGGSQGLPPHHDDIEAFVLQLEGQKRWRLYKPILELPRSYSDGLSEAEIGEPTHTVILNPGDLLYFPRGTIHQADTPPAVHHSTHITISTYQHHSWGDYMMSVFPSLIEEAMNTDIDFRRGLPINFIKSTKLSKTDKVQSVMEILHNKLVKICTQKFLMPESMVEDFMRSRLPPYELRQAGALRECIPDGPPPDLGCKVRLRFPDHVCFLIQRNVEEGMDEDDSSDEESCSADGGSEGGEPEYSSGSTRSNQTLELSLPNQDSESLVVYSSIFNERPHHMLSTRDKTEMGFALRFPKHYLNAMSHLKSSCDQFTSVKDIALPSDDDRVGLIRALWSSHLLEVIPSANRKGTKSTKLD